MLSSDTPTTAVSAEAPPVQAAARGWQSRRTRRRAGAWTSHVLLLAGAVVMVIPFVWMVSTSFKAPGKTFVYPPQWIPDPFVWQNYPAMWTALPFNHFFVNSIKIASLATLGQLLTCSMGGFTFGVLRFRGRDVLFLALIATLMVPYQVTLIPTFILFSKLGWVGTHLPLWVPAFWGGAFGTFLMRQFFMTIPIDLAESARMDGANIGRRLAIKNGGKARDVGFGDMLKHNVCLTNAVLRSGVLRRVIGKLDSNRPSLQHSGIGHQFASEGVAIGAKIGGAVEGDGFWRRRWRWGVGRRRFIVNDSWWRQGDGGHNRRRQGGCSGGRYGRFYRSGFNRSSLTSAAIWNHGLFATAGRQSN